MRLHPVCCYRCMLQLSRLRKGPGCCWITAAAVAGARSSLRRSAFWLRYDADGTSVPPAHALAALHGGADGGQVSIHAAVLAQDACLALVRLAACAACTAAVARWVAPFAAAVTVGCAAAARLVTPVTTLAARGAVS
jgi:hypothetical protein